MTVKSLTLRTLVTLKLTSLETFILAAILTAAEGVQVNITMSANTHYVVAAFILLLASVVKPLLPGQFLAALPIELVYVIQAILGALLIFSTHFNISSLWHTVISVVIVAFVSLGVGPAPAPASAVKALS